MKLLVTGNIGYITTEFIKEAFPECQILLLGETALKSDRRKGISVHPMPHAEKEFEDIFKTYEFEGVIYFSNYLTFHGKKDGELETLRKVLHYIKEIRIHDCCILPVRRVCMRKRPERH